MRISDWSSDVCSSDLSCTKIRTVTTIAACRSGPLGGIALGRYLGLLKSKIDRIEQPRRAQIVDSGQVAATLEPEMAQEFRRSEEHTSDLPSLMRTSYAVLCLTNNYKAYTSTHYRHSV